MSIYEKLLTGEAKLSLIGLGYVGLPIAIAFARKVEVIGFDVNSAKIALYKQGIDPTREVGNSAVRETSVAFTSDETRLKDALFHIVAVPTPVNDDHSPDLGPVKSASHLLGRNLVRGAIVVYESTVYPGVTEDICVPILEAESGLTCGVDFKVGYSPERINPGDHLHRLENIIKVVSGMDADSLETIARTYELVVEAGVHRAETIKVAEAAKVIENAQRDINIAFMNELAIIFNKMGIDTQAVLRAAGTKWNFLKFFPGLVGGHCIGVDPYYLTHKAEQLGYHSRIILAGRQINDDMGQYIATQLVKAIIQAELPVHAAKVAILGFTFKENVPDTRNTKVIDIINELKTYGIKPLVVDPVADSGEALHEYGLTLAPLEQVKDVDALVIAVSHDKFRELTLPQIDALYQAKPGAPKILFDIKGLLDRKTVEAAGYRYWRL